MSTERWACRHCVLVTMRLALKGVEGWGSMEGRGQREGGGEAWQHLDEGGGRCLLGQGQKGTLCPAACPLSASWLSPQGPEWEGLEEGSKRPNPHGLHGQADWVQIQIPLPCKLHHSGQCLLLRPFPGVTGCSPSPGGLLWG